MEKMNFKKEIKWKEGQRFCKLKPKQTNNGKTYYQADMNNFLITSYGIDQWGNIDLKFIPIQYHKVDGSQEQHTASSQGFNQQSGDIPSENSDVPF